MSKQILLGLLRSDLGPLTLTGLGPLTSTVQRPTDPDLIKVYKQYGYISMVGSDISSTVNTTVSDFVRLRTRDDGNFVNVYINTIDSALAKSVFVKEINAAFRVKNLPVEMVLNSDNTLLLKTTAPNSTLDLYLETDAYVSGGLNEDLGFPQNASRDLSGTINTCLDDVLGSGRDLCRPTEINILGDFADYMTYDDRGILLTKVRELISPPLAETGLVKLSAALGQLSKLSLPSFQPGGDRSGLPAGAAVKLLEYDGATIYVT